MRKIDVDDLVEDDSMNLYKTKKPIRWTRYLKGILHPDTLYWKLNMIGGLMLTSAQSVQVKNGQTIKILKATED